MRPETKPTFRPPTTARTPLWIIAVLLAFVAGALWAGFPRESTSTAFAQVPQLAGARGVYAFTGQIDHNRFGLFMLDVDQGTIWCYEIDSVGGVRKLRLISARTWVYDRYLQDFNCAAPNFRMVQELVAQQRGQTGQPADQQAGPDVDQDEPAVPGQASPEQR